MKHRKTTKLFCMILALSFMLSFSVYAESTEEPSGNSWRTFEFADTTDTNDVLKPFHFDEFIQDSLNNGASTCTIRGSDDRVVVEDTTQMPYSAICYLDIEYDSGTLCGTGWLFGEDLLITAAHCIYSEQYGMATGIAVYPGRNGSTLPFGSCRATECIMSEAWCESFLDADDVAIVKLNRPVGAQCGYFDFERRGGSVGDDITISGYIAYLNDYKPLTMSGRLNAVTLERLYYLIDTDSGQSGSPIYLTGTNTVIGTHTGGNMVSNVGVRIDNRLYEAMINALNE